MARVKKSAAKAATGKAAGKAVVAKKAPVAKKAAAKQPVAKKSAPKKPAADRPTTRSTAAKTPAPRTKTNKTVTCAGTGKGSAITARRAAGTQPKLLSGGNPQIPKGYGDEAVQSYVRAMPGWKRAVGEQLDALIERAVPGVYKAVKWNTPLYGIQGQGWFAAFHCFDRYIKVTFFRGASLDPVPPVASKMAQTRYLHVADDGQLDQAQFVAWVRQASRLPGEIM